MFFLYSKSCEYAVRALTVVDRNKDCFQVDEICRKAKVPAHYASKAIARLADAGILEAVRGRGGGYRFIMNPGKIPVLKLIEAIDGQDAFRRCVMGLPQCGDQRPCPLHATWQGVKGKYLQDLQDKTLEDLMRFSEFGRAKRSKLKGVGKKVGIRSKKK